MGRWATKEQDVSVSGGLIHAHTRDPFLASLPKEALEQLTRAYDEVLAKYIPDAPQIQDNSSTAIEAESVSLDKLKEADGLS